MPRFKILLVALAAMFATLSCSEKADDQKGASKEVQLDITLDKYYNSQGEHTTRTWAKTDKVALMNMSATKKSQTASPATEGAASSKFSFTFEGANNGDQLLAYTPATANVRINSGKINLTLNEKQTGTVEKPFYIGKGSFSESGASIKLGNPYATLVANLKQGEYTIKKAVLKTNGGEKIAGTIALEYDTMELTGNTNSVTVEFNNGLDCRKQAQTFAFQITPVTMANGYTITFITDSGSFTYKKDGSVTCTAGGKVDTEPIEGVSETSLLLCGDSMIYLIDPAVAMKENDYKKAIIWEWDAKVEKATIGKDMLRLDDCKPVDNKSKILASSSRGYAVLLDFNTKKLLWYSNISTQAHSIEYLPNNRIAVACSTGGDCVQIFDVNGSNKVLFSTDLTSAHGVVWNPATERLYAVGKTSLNIYQLTDWNTSSPKLTLEKTVNTKEYVTGLHDLTLVDDKTLLVAGKKAALFNLETNKFTKLPHFNSSTALKSVNYNAETGECWYTDATGTDRELDWSSNDIRYTSNVNMSGGQKSIWIGDINMYKVRVFNW